MRGDAERKHHTIANWRIRIMSWFTLGRLWYEGGNRRMPKYMPYGLGDWVSFVDGYEFARGAF